MNASPALLTAVSSMSSERPVRPAPDARVPRWITRPVQRAAEPPVLAAGRAADPAVRAARWVVSRTFRQEAPAPIVPSILRIGQRNDPAGPRMLKRWRRWGRITRREHCTHAYPAPRA